MSGLTRRHHLVSLAAVGAFLGTASPANAVAIKDYLDTWSGTLKTTSGEVRLELDIVSETAASLYRIDQGGVEIKATSVKLTADSISLAFSSIGSRFDGSLSGANLIKGTYTEGGVSLTLEFERGELFVAGPAPIEFTSKALSETRRSSGIPALGAAFAKDGASATILVDGLRSLEATVPVTSDDRWHLASVTKSMTATLVARLVEAGKVSWDDTIGGVLGASIPEINDSYQRVTFRHLLSHHSGLQPEIESKDFDTFRRDSLDDVLVERLRYASLALRQPPASAPGTKLLYANNGYVVAGAMLEARCKQSWESLINRYVFSPLGLISAGFGVPGTSGKLDEPVGHLVSPAVPGKLIPANLVPGEVIDNPGVIGPCGQVHMNLADLVSYLNAHLLCPDGFLKANSWNVLHTPPYSGNYAMGWEVGADGRLSHTGNNRRWYAAAAVDPSKGAVAAAVANEGDVQKMPLIVGAVLEGALQRASA